MTNSKKKTSLSEHKATSTAGCGTIGRRSFMSAMTGALSCMVVPWGKSKSKGIDQIKEVVTQLEIDEIKEAWPLQNPGLTCKAYEKQNVLCKTGNTQEPRCFINLPGKLIWEACNGKNTPADISRSVCEQYDVDPAKAYSDTLAFLVRLKRIGAVQV